jgi:hypothetical protein
LLDEDEVARDLLMSVTALQFVESEVIELDGLPMLLPVLLVPPPVVEPEVDPEVEPGLLPDIDPLELLVSLP